MKEHIAITMGADLAALRVAMEKANALVKSTMASMTKVVVAAASVIGVALGFREIAKSIGEVVRKGKELDMLSRESGRSAAEIALFTEQTNRAELSMSEAADVMQEWSGQWRAAALGATNLTTKLALLDLTTEQLAGKSLPEQFDVIAKKLNQMRDPVIRNQLAMELFGAAGKKAVANYQSGDLESAARLMGKNALELAAASRTMGLIDDAWKRIRRAGEVLFTAIATRVAPVLQLVVEKMQELLPKLQEWGAAIGDKLIEGAKIVIGLLANGDIGEVLKLGFEIAARWLGDFLVQSFTFAANLLVKGFVAAAKVLTDVNLWMGVLKVFGAIGQVLLDAGYNVIQLLGNGDVWAAVGKAALGAFMVLHSYVVKMFADLVENLAAGLIWGMSQAAQLLINAMMWVIKKIPGFKDAVTPQLGVSFDEAKGAVKDMGVLDKLRNLGDKEQTKGGDLINQAAEHLDKALGSIDFKSMTAEGAKVLKDAMADLSKVDFEPMKQLFKEVPDLWKKSASEIFADPALMKRLQDVIAQARAKGAEILKSQKKADARPGETGKGPAVRAGFGSGGVFDEMRRVGGGMGRAVQNIQQKMYDKLAEIANNSSAQTGLLQQVVAKNTGGGGKTLELGGVS